MTNHRPKEDTKEESERKAAVILKINFWNVLNLEFIKENNEIYRYQNREKYSAKKLVKTHSKTKMLNIFRIFRMYISLQKIEK